MATISVPDPATPNRRGLLVAEIVVLVIANVADVVLLLRTMPTGTGLAPAVFGPLVPAVGPAAATLAVLRRRFPYRIAALGVAVGALSLVSTAGSAAVAATGQGTRAYPGIAETIAVALLVGAASRRLTARSAAGVAAFGALAMVATPLVRYAPGSPAALLAVPAALLWGAAVAVGLILRDADRRRLAELTGVRATERLQLARELHDLVAHHLAGIVVRVQAARTVADAGAAAEVYADIEHAGTEALTAMRRLLGMLRTSEPAAVLPGARLDTAVHTAVRTVAGEDSDGITVDTAPELDALPVRPELTVTVHRIVLEALTNARQHAPDATEVTVTVGIESGQLVLDVANDGVAATRVHRSGSGYGLIGMSERVTALGGTFRAGPEAGRRWRIVARLPVGSGRMPDE